jgi:hypothetical protein
VNCAGLGQLGVIPTSSTVFRPLLFQAKDVGMSAAGKLI